jgi:hypothetical protein
LQILPKIYWREELILVLALFAFIAWLTIIVFSFIPKSLSTEENIIMFFILNITTISVYTILTLNLRLIEPSNALDAFIAQCIHRSLIIPLCLLTLINLTFSYDQKLKKITVSIIAILILNFIELLTVWASLKSFTGWNSFLTILSLIVLVVFFNVLARLLKRI